jgi:CcmD family protein
MTSRLYMLQSAAPAPSSTGTTADDRSTSFRPVEGGNQMQSGERLLVEAYAAIWLIVFAMILLSWRRQAHLDQRIATLEDALRKARNSGDS